VAELGLLEPKVSITMATSNRNYKLYIFTVFPSSGMKNLRSVENRKSNFSFKIFIFLPDLLPWMDTPLFSPPPPQLHSGLAPNSVQFPHFCKVSQFISIGTGMARVTDTADIGVTKIPMQCMMVLSMTIH
jgi:hypothetical protein